MYKQCGITVAVPDENHTFVKAIKGRILFTESRKEFEKNLPELFIIDEESRFQYFRRCYEIICREKVKQYKTRKFLVTHHEINFHTLVEMKIFIGSSVDIRKYLKKQDQYKQEIVNQIRDSLGIEKPEIIKKRKGIFKIEKNWSKKKEKS
ncbi:hypothetical protein DICPUDRAFT_73207, partial [Dictyostelium purpureum]